MSKAKKRKANKIKTFNLKIKRVTGSDARDILMYLRTWAEGLAYYKGNSSARRRDYLKLADAADDLDAKLARAIIQ